MDLKTASELLDYIPNRAGCSTQAHIERISFFAPKLLPLPLTYYWMILIYLLNKGVPGISICPN